MSKTFCFTAQEEHKGIKIKDFLHHCGVSSRTLTRLKKGGSILLNNSPCYATQHINCGDNVKIILPEDTASDYVDFDIPLDIKYEDDYLLIINKPPHMAVHPSIGNYGNTLADAVLTYYKKHGITSTFRPVNRLDKGTSGLMTVSKDAHIHKMLSDYMSQKLMKRKYYAIIEGEITPHEGTIDLPIERKEGVVMAREVNPNGKNAITLYKTLQTNGERSLLEVELLTGRTHQIRVHFSHLGHPLVGDWLYGKEEVFMPRPALHSYYLRLQHPITGKQLEFSTYLPEDMQSII